MFSLLFLPSFFFFFNDPATTEIYTLSLHDALPISFSMARQAVHLDLLPRLRVLQTSALEQSQIYVPIVNWLVFLAVSAFVVGFGSARSEEYTSELQSHSDLVCRLLLEKKKKK